MHLGDFVKVVWILHVSGHQSDPLPSVLGPSRLLYRMRLESALVRLSGGVLEEPDTISGRI